MGLPIATPKGDPPIFPSRDEFLRYLQSVNDLAQSMAKFISIQQQRDKEEPFRIEVTKQNDLFLAQAPGIVHSLHNFSAQALSVIITDGGYGSASASSKIIYAGTLNPGQDTGYTFRPFKMGLYCASLNNLGVQVSGGIVIAGVFN